MIFASLKSGAYLFRRRFMRRPVYVILAFGLGAATTWYYRVAAFGILIAPAGGMLSPYDGLPVYNSVVGPMKATFKIALYGGSAAALPVLTISLLTRFKQHIPVRLWRFLLIFIPVTGACFLAGAAFVYYVMLPAGLAFLLTFATGIAQPMILLSEYISLLFSLMLWVGVIFELPVAMFLLSKMGIVRYRHFSRVPRKIIAIAALIMGAILTPTFDVVNQLLLSVPIFMLYEVGLLASWLARPEEGNYLYLRTIGRWIRNVRDGIVWVVRRPVVMIRWFQRKIVEYGLGWLW